MTKWWDFPLYFPFFLFWVSVPAEQITLKLSTIKLHPFYYISLFLWVRNLSRSCLAGPFLCSTWLKSLGRIQLADWLSPRLQGSFPLSGSRWDGWRAGLGWNCQLMHLTLASQTWRSQYHQGFFSFGSMIACRILVPWPGINLVLPAVEACSPND